MGVLTTLSETQVSWKPDKTTEPPEGTYTYRGLTKQGSPIYQCDAAPNTICIKLMNQLVAVGDIQLQDLQHSTGAGGGGANFGLTQSVNTLFSFNTFTEEVATHRYNGQPSTTKDTGAVASNANTFNIPSFISDGDGNRYYPLNYWFSSGNVQYFNPSPPVSIVDEKLKEAGNTYSKIQQLTKLTAQDIRTYDGQARSPDQSHVMGTALGSSNPISAREHLLTVFSISSEPRSWHWCHLIAHSMRPNEKGQVATNLVAGTAGVNGAMLALEKAIKEFLRENEKTVSHLDYEVEAHVLNGSHIAKFIKATVGQFGSWAFVHRMEASVAERELTAQTAEFKAKIAEAAKAASLMLT